MARPEDVLANRLQTWLTGEGIGLTTAQQRRLEGQAQGMINEIYHSDNPPTWDPVTDGARSGNVVGTVEVGAAGTYDIVRWSPSEYTLVAR